MSKLDNPSEYPYTIGVLAKKAQVNVETIRFYERKKLIQQPPKPKTGYRQYPKDTLQLIKFIKKAQELGFTLDEINSLIELSEGNCNKVEEIANKKILLIKNKINDLNKLLVILQNLSSLCVNNEDKSQKCPLMESITSSLD